MIKFIYKMNKLEYYDRQKEAWDDKELEYLKSYYETKEMTISQIADIHRRTPGSISHKLKVLDLIPHYTLSRGYLDYKNSNLYKEIIETSKTIKSDKKAKNEARLKEKVKSLPDITITKEINEIQKEIASLKKDVKEMLRLMNALYDFETEQRIDTA